MGLFLAKRLLADTENLQCQMLENILRIIEDLIKNLSLENTFHKTIYSHLNNGNYAELVDVLADSSIKADEVSVSIILNSAYMKNIPVEVIFDEIVEPQVT